MTPPPEKLGDVVRPALEVGGAAAFCGFTVGAFAGVLRSTSPTLFALVSAVQWFTLGATYRASRGLLLQRWGHDDLSSKEKIQVSSIAGGMSGAVGGCLRSRKNIIPGAIMFTIFGATGQAIYNIADARMSARSEKISDPKDSWLHSKWSPMKPLSDDEYRTMLEEKLLKVNVELSLLDEGIESLKSQPKENDARKDGPAKS